ncbi:MAG: hypothetical protein A2033_12830 [Bacteroidetes bacterium GWA2_31_9]|nr:MAG: hypothetical protein A2033_12830 [Bacteroidetes bacterium GWA2_31_9]
MKMTKFKILRYSIIGISAIFIIFVTYIILSYEINKKNYDNEFINKNEVIINNLLTEALLNNIELEISSYCDSVLHYNKIYTGECILNKGIVDSILLSNNIDTIYMDINVSNLPNNYNFNTLINVENLSITAFIKVKDLSKYIPKNFFRFNNFKTKLTQSLIQYNIKSSEIISTLRIDVVIVIYSFIFLFIYFFLNGAQLFDKQESLPINLDNNISEIRKKTKQIYNGSWVLLFTGIVFIALGFMFFYFNLPERIPIDINNTEYFKQYVVQSIRPFLMLIFFESSAILIFKQYRNLMSDFKEIFNIYIYRCNIKISADLLANLKKGGNDIVLIIALLNEHFKSGLFNSSKENSLENPSDNTSVINELLKLLKEWK